MDSGRRSLVAAKSSELPAAMIDVTKRVLWGSGPLCCSVLRPVLVHILGHKWQDS